jgi:hypothetical protein
MGARDPIVRHARANGISVADWEWSASRWLFALPAGAIRSILQQKQ